MIISIFRPHWSSPCPRITICFWHLLYYVIKTQFKVPKDPYWGLLGDLPSTRDIFWLSMYLNGIRVPMIYLQYILMPLESWCGQHIVSLRPHLGPEVEKSDWYSCSVVLVTPGMAVSSQSPAWPLTTPWLSGSLSPSGRPSWRLSSTSINSTWSDLDSSYLNTIISFLLYSLNNMEVHKTVFLSL